MNSYGIRGVAGEWLRSNLSDRLQYVKLDSNKSATVPIKCGVPQGSILDPLLYLIYVNDIGNSCQGIICRWYYIVSDCDIKTLFNNSNKQINQFFKWFCSKKLSLNSKKTKYIVLQPKHKRADLTKFIIHINYTILERIGNDCDEKSTKFLGMHIDETLAWKYHVNEVKNKVARALLSIKQVKCITNRMFFSNKLSFHLWNDKHGVIESSSPLWCCKSEL